ncbi:MAG: hypothetical protein OXF48_06170, partial [Bacteroidetes bacterium]|nr:hypothetical protein [Bacteroidota bacterium]
TFTGYSATIEGRDYITISLDEDTALPEGVVVTVGGIERKERALGYSVTEIDGEDLREVPKKQVFGLSSVSMTSEPSCPIHVRIVLKSSS